ncbi:hypothetical protein [Rhizobium laguerreae]|uniref:hypothetical protein n=1 Tax=Rhizobium laguerreae TaxID=1076926 RepID=UPI001C9260C1|nr:hypothetical protein [Rhizobium laguerreae]MBY3383206.1 hypothetical protein [Rhizobium laguerreae]
MPTNDDDLTDKSETPATPGSSSVQQSSEATPIQGAPLPTGETPTGDVKREAGGAVDPPAVATPDPGEEKIDCAATFTAAPFTASIVGWLALPLKIAILGVATIAIVWSTLYFVHLVIPSRIFSPDIAQFKQDLFRDADVYLGRQEEISNNFNPAMSVGASVRVLLASCMPEENPENNGLYIRAKGLFDSVAIFAQEIALTSGQYFVELNQLRSRTIWYASVLIVLGMLTTIVSALNSSQFGSGPSTSASFIKIVAIILPALATAITAYAALNASSDQTAVKSQLVFNLSALGAQMNTDLNAIHCPIEADSEIDTVYKKMAAWRQKQTDSILSIEFSQGRPKSTPTGEEGVGNGVTPTPAGGGQAAPAQAS